MRKTLDEVLLEAGLLDEAGARSARLAARREHIALATQLYESNAISDEAMVSALEKALRMKRITLAGETIDEEALREVPHDLASARLLLPLSIDRSSRTIRVAAADPLDLEAQEEIEVQTGCQVDAALMRAGELAEGIQRHYRGIITKMIPRRTEGQAGGGESSAAADSSDDATTLRVWIDALVDQLAEHGAIDRGALENTVRERTRRKLGDG
jgi:hypothetical protein